jgi:hypothetical protein
MIRWLLLLMAGFSSAAPAQTARVISGEHSDFTRLVIELPEAADWMVGRTAMGYGFTTLAPIQPGYDLSGVWDRIPRTRLQALRVDPESGALLLALACVCHVFPFEYQPGMVVLDVRTGPAPTGSVFEANMTRAAPLKLRDPPPFAPVETVYDWLGGPLKAPVRAPSVPLRLSLGREDPSLDPLREELLLQLSRGAVDGVVDMVLPEKRREPELLGMGDLSGALIRIGELPGLEVGNDSLEADEEGNQCIRDEAIDLPNWGDGRPPLDLLAAARAGLYQEFDALSPEALETAVRLHLYLGFGAEARQYAALLADEENEVDLSPLLSMARLIDGEVDPTSPFASMLGCDGSAALWAALAHSSLPTGAAVDTKAVVRSFQALPPHLRRHLGPRLASLLLQRDAEAARMIRDAFQRTPGSPAGAVALMDAEADLNASRPGAALNHAETAVLEDGAGLQGLVALVEAHFRSGVPLAPEVSHSLMALRDVSGEDKARHERALVLALVLSGHVEEAFALASPDRPYSADLWRALMQQGDDNAFLAQAVLRQVEAPPKVDAEVGLAIADRLAGLGFYDAALIWLGATDASATLERRIATARAQLGLGNAREVLQLLSGADGVEAQGLLVKAYQELGAYEAARRLLVEAGKPEESNRLAAWDRDWDALKAGGSQIWAEASALVEPAQAVAQGLLGEGRDALDDSAAARSAILALLAEVPSPP